MSFGNNPGNSLVSQGLELNALTVEAPGSVPVWGAKIPQASRHGQKKNKKEIQISAQVNIFQFSSSFFLYTFYKSIIVISMSLVFFIFVYTEF